MTIVQNTERGRKT